jgi:hypothetical protein
VANHLTASKIIAGEHKWNAAYQHRDIAHHSSPSSESRIERMRKRASQSAREFERSEAEQSFCLFQRTHDLKVSTLSIQE